MMKYFIIAGEASGDLHGSNLIRGIKSVDPGSEIRCWGGEMMQQAGALLLKHYKESAVMGFVEVLMKSGTIIKNLRRCKRDILEYRPDLIVLIDYPGFNMKIAEFAHKNSIPLFYYIAPKVWAWKEGRIKRLKKYVERLFIIFPFEIEYFRSHGIEAIYNGNPLLDSIANYKYAGESREEFCKRHSLDEKKEIVALLAGSRKNEIKYLLPKMAELSKEYDSYLFLLAAAPSTDIRLYNDIIAAHGGANITIIRDETYSVLRHAKGAIISSGTASLEAALIGTPQIVCYGGNEISYLIARAVVKLKYISLANLILDKPIFKELIQHDCTVKNMERELERILTDKACIEAMKGDYARVREILGGEGASVKVAQSMVQEYKKLKADDHRGNSL